MIQFNTEGMFKLVFTLRHSAIRSVHKKSLSFVSIVAI